MAKQWQKRDSKQHAAHPYPPPLKEPRTKVCLFSNFFVIFFVSIDWSMLWSIFIVLDALYNAYIGVSFGLYRIKRFGMIN